MIAYKHPLFAKQKQDILNALQTGSDVRIKPTKTQQGNGFGTILASIGTPLAIELVKKRNWQGSTKIGRRPLQIKQDGHGAPRIGVYEAPPPFIGTWEQMRGSGKKKPQTPKRGQGLLLGANSPFKNVPVLNLIL